MTLCYRIRTSNRKMVSSAPSSKHSDFFRFCPNHSIPESFLAQVLIAYIVMQALQTLWAFETGVR